LEFRHDLFATGVSFVRHWARAAAGWLGPAVRIARKISPGTGLAANVKFSRANPLAFPEKCSRKGQAISPFMHYVYVLRSIAHPGHHYVGSTEDLRRRFHQHNSRASVHTAKHRPWKLVWYAGFTDQAAALRFELYLKTASGRRFQKRHLSEAS